MGGALAILGVVLCLSLLEGLWAWLLASAVAEVAGQAYPLFGFVGLVLFAGWFVARMLILNHVPVERQRWVLVVAGLALALVAGTIQAGVLVPVQLIFGTYTPDLRGAGVVLVILVAYLWGRGLSLAAEVTRDRVINHIAISASALTCVLVFLPLTDAVQSLGLGTVVSSFAMAIATLLLIQAIGVEAHELTPTRWGLIASGFVVVVLLAGGALTGALSSSLLLAIGGVLRSWGQVMTPLTDAILLGLGHLTEWLVDGLVWLGEFFGTDAAKVLKSMREAEQARPQFDQDAQQGAPAMLSVVVAIFSTLFFGAVAVLIYHRLIGRYLGRDDADIEETRSRTHRPRGGGLRDLFGRLRRRGPDDSDLDVRNPREAIRLHYRRFQIIMARAGLPRTGHETPLEFGSQMARILPTARDDLLDVADAYDRARYGEPDTPVPAADGIEEAVHRIRAALATLPDRPDRASSQGD